MSVDVLEKAKEVVIARADNPELVQGRREFFSYRELGVTKATDGQMRAQVTIATQGLSEETGWHIHLCEGQFVYILDGWVDLEFAGNRKERIVAGDSIFIRATRRTTRPRRRTNSRSWKSQFLPTWARSPATSRIKSRTTSWCRPALDTGSRQRLFQTGLLDPGSGPG